MYSYAGLGRNLFLTQLPTHLKTEPDMQIVSNSIHTV